MKNNITNINKKKTSNEKMLNAIADYKGGKIGPWELWEVVNELGFSGWTGNSDGSIVIHGG